MARKSSGPRRAAAVDRFGIKAWNKIRAGSALTALRSRLFGSKANIQGILIMLNSLGLDKPTVGRESVSILVGPNGSGKSSFLRRLVARHRDDRNISIVCNTPHDRFVGLRGVRRISVGKVGGSPKVVVKRAVAESLAGSGAGFYHVSSILEYCGYEARFGFSIIPGPLYGAEPRELEARMGRSLTEALYDVVSISRFSSEAEGLNSADFEIATSFFRRHDPFQKIWIDAAGKTLEFSRSREFASALRLESKLRAWKVVRGIRVFLQPLKGGSPIEIQHASSGQLALISSLLFLITSLGEEPVVIIDEPENSLHPNWQREYVDKVLAALSYRGATVVMATHAPLIVTGSLAKHSDLVSVFAVRDGRMERLPIDRSSKSLGNIEEVLWQAFDVVTPANHFVSARIVDEISRFEKGQVGKADVMALIDNMREESFDERQRSFFDAVLALLDKVEANQSGNG